MMPFLEFLSYCTADESKGDSDGGMGSYDAPSMLVIDRARVRKVHVWRARWTFDPSVPSSEEVGIRLVSCVLEQLFINRDEE